MNLITTILFVVALVLFVICTIGVPSPPRFNLMAAGLAFVVLAILATTVHAEQSVEDQRREQRAYEREIAKHSELREHTVKERYAPATCSEWRRRVEHHPRLLLPRRCYRRW